MVTSVQKVESFNLDSETVNWGSVQAKESEIHTDVFIEANGMLEESWLAFTFQNILVSLVQG